MSGLIEKVKEKVDQVLHKDQHQNTAGTHTGTHTGTGAHTGTGVGGTHTGVGGTHTGVGGTHTGSTNTGPHGSNLANKADPRVDSDRDHSSNLGTAQHGPGAHNTHGHTHNTAVGGTTTSGPHSSNLANKLDPRVDSDRDGSNNFGAAGHSSAHPGATGGFGSTGHSTNTGPHGSNLANKADPRVDSDRDHSSNVGAAQYGPGSHNTGVHTGVGGSGNTYGTSHNTSGGLGSHGTSTNAGPHDSNMLNKLDPRVDSDRDGSTNQASHGTTAGYGHQQAGLGSTGQGYGAQGTTGQGYGTTHNTTGGLGSHGTSTNTGPHDSNMLNKLDPRVDSNRDGSHPGQAAANQASHGTTGQGYGQQGGLGGQGGAY